MLLSWLDSAFVYFCELICLWRRKGSHVTKVAHNLYWHWLIMSALIRPFRPCCVYFKMLQSCFNEDILRILFWAFDVMKNRRGLVLLVDPTRSIVGKDLDILLETIVVITLMLVLQIHVKEGPNSITNRWYWNLLESFGEELMDHRKNKGTNQQIYALNHELTLCDTANQELWMQGVQHWMRRVPF